MLWFDEKSISNLLKLQISFLKIYSDIHCFELIVNIEYVLKMCVWSPIMKKQIFSTIYYVLIFLEFNMSKVTPEDIEKKNSPNETKSIGSHNESVPDFFDYLEPERASSGTQTWTRKGPGPCKQLPD